MPGYINYINVDILLLYNHIYKVVRNMAKIEIEIDPQKVIDNMIEQMDTQALWALNHKVLQRLQGAETEPKGIDSIDRKCKYREGITRRRYTQAEMEEIRLVVLRSPGFIVPHSKILDLASKQKRSLGAIENKIRIESRKALANKRRSLLAEVQEKVQKDTKPLTIKAPKTKPKKTRKYTMSDDRKKVLKLAREIMHNSPVEGKMFGYYIGQASKQLKAAEGGANTQVQSSGNGTDKKVPARSEAKTGTVGSFPRIFPLTELGNSTFKTVMWDLIHNRRREFTLKLAKNSLQLPDNVEWNPSIWEQFLQQVAYNDKQIFKHFNVKKNIVVEWKDGKKVLKVKG